MNEQLESQNQEEILNSVLEKAEKDTANTTIMDNGDKIFGPFPRNCNVGRRKAAESAAVAAAAGAILIESSDSEESSGDSSSSNDSGSSNDISSSTSNGSSNSTQDYESSGTFVPEASHLISSQRPVRQRRRQRRRRRQVPQHKHGENGEEEEEEEVEGGFGHSTAVERPQQQYHLARPQASTGGQWLSISTTNDIDQVAATRSSQDTTSNSSDAAAANEVEADTDEVALAKKSTTTTTITSTVTTATNATTPTTTTLVSSGEPDWASSSSSSPESSESDSRDPTWQVRNRGAQKQGAKKKRRKKAVERERKNYIDAAELPVPSHMTADTGFQDEDFLAEIVFDPAKWDPADVATYMEESRKLGHGTEKSFDVLCNFQARDGVSIKQLLMYLRKTGAPSAASPLHWSDEEIEVFEASYLEECCQNGGKKQIAFRAAANRINKTFAECVKFYYIWKKMERGKTVREEARLRANNPESDSEVEEGAADAGVSGSNVGSILDAEPDLESQSRAEEAVPAVARITLAAMATVGVEVDPAIEQGKLYSVESDSSEHNGNDEYAYATQVWHAPRPEIEQEKEGETEAAAATAEAVAVAVAESRSEPEPEPEPEPELEPESEPEPEPEPEPELEAELEAELEPELEADRYPNDFQPEMAPSPEGPWWDNDTMSQSSKSASQPIADKEHKEHNEQRCQEEAMPMRVCESESESEELVICQTQHTNGKIAALEEEEAIASEPQEAEDYCTDGGGSGGGGGEGEEVETYAPSDGGEEVETLAPPYALPPPRASPSPHDSPSRHDLASSSALQLQKASAEEESDSSSDASIDYARPPAAISDSESESESNTRTLAAAATAEVMARAQATETVSTSSASSTSHRNKPKKTRPKKRKRHRGGGGGGGSGGGGSGGGGGGILAQLNVTKVRHDEESESLGDDTYVVDYIVDEKPKLNKKGEPTGHMLYFIKWCGYGSEDNTWEPDVNILDPDIISSWKLNQIEKNRKRARQTNQN